MERTKNYSLRKPGEDDFYDIADFNQNADVIDQELKRVEKSVEEAVEEMRGEIADLDLGEFSEVLNQKVDKIPGKELSTHDFSKEDKSQISENKQDIAMLQSSKESLIKNAPVKTTLADADTVPLSDSIISNTTKKITFANIKATLKSYFDTLYNRYVHPNYASRPSGLYKTTIDNTGHVSVTATVEKLDITALGIPGQDTVYTHPTWDGWNHVPAGGSAGQVLKWGAASTAEWGAPIEKSYGHIAYRESFASRERKTKYIAIGVGKKYGQCVLYSTNYEVGAFISFNTNHLNSFGIYMGENEGGALHMKRGWSYIAELSYRTKVCEAYIEGTNLVIVIENSLTSKLDNEGTEVCWEVW